MAESTERVGPNGEKQLLEILIMCCRSLFNEGIVVSEVAFLNKCSEETFLSKYFVFIFSKKNFYLLLRSYEYEISLLLILCTFGDNLV